MENNEETQRPVYISYNKTESSIFCFISYLISALDRKGINQFYGLTINLVVFSSDYVSSASCLENLMKLLELSRLDKDSYMVVPVFYGVSRLVVKQQPGMFSDALTELERLYSKDQVAKWRCALAETAELQGHDYNDELSEESKFLEEIAQDVFEKLYPTKEIGIHKRQLDIENVLCNQPWGVRTLGILGKPGIGKTTLTIAVLRQMSSGYDTSCFIENFHSRFMKKILEPLHGSFLCMIPMEDFDINNPDVEPQRLRQKRVLIALDDVQNARDAESFLGGFYRFGPGSLIIITSRNKRVLEQCNVNEIYEVQGLNDEDALKLFTRCAFGNRAMEQNLLDLSTRVIKCSDGNPTTLISYAKTLNGKTTTEMESALLKICHDSCTDTKKNIPTCVITYDEHSVLDISAAQIFLSDLKKFQIFNRTDRIGESVHSDLRIPQLDHDPEMQSFLQGFASLFNKIWERGGCYKNFSRLKRINLGHLETLVEVEELSEARGLEEIDLRDCKKLESIPVTDKLERLQVLNLSGCNGIKRFPRVVWTIRELNLEGTGIREIRSETTKYSQLVKQQSTTTTLKFT